MTSISLSCNLNGDTCSDYVDTGRPGSPNSLLTLVVFFFRVSSLSGASLLSTSTFSERRRGLDYPRSPTSSFASTFSISPFRVFTQDTLGVTTSSGRVTTSPDTSCLSPPLTTVSSSHPRVPNASSCPTSSLHTHLPSPPVSTRSYVCAPSTSRVPSTSLTLLHPPYTGASSVSGTGGSPYGGRSVYCTFLCWHHLWDSSSTGLRPRHTNGRRIPDTTCVSSVDVPSPTDLSSCTPIPQLTVITTDLTTPPTDGGTGSCTCPSWVSPRRRGGRRVSWGPPL